MVPRISQESASNLLGEPRDSHLNFSGLHWFICKRWYNDAFILQNFGSDLITS